MPKVNSEPKRSTKPPKKKPYLHNRASGVTGNVRPPGLATKVEKPDVEATAGKKNNISKGLRPLIVDIEGLVPDPMNARLHPDRNLDSIKASLNLYGQLKALVVRKGTNVVIAGNGTLEAAKALGWTKIAANFEEFESDAAAAGYGLADNRTAELAKWDFETVARIDKLLADAGHGMVGWSLDELEVLRMADWTPPPEQFPEVGEGIETEHACPRCGYRFSGGSAPEESKDAEIERLTKLTENLAERVAGRSELLSKKAEKKR